MPISVGWSSSSLISDVLPEEDDEMHINENDKLRNRVMELEKVVVMQRNEIMLLQASTADILRRVQILESKQPSNYNSLPRSSGMMSSRSLYTVGTSPSAVGRRQKSPMTKSMYNNEHEFDSEQHRSRNDMVNVSIGKSARGSPMRKWISTNEIKEGSDRLRRLSTSSEASTSIIPPTSNCVRRMNFRPPRSCNFNKFDTHLPIFVNGKTVNVPVPSEYEQIDPTSEQDPPDVKAVLKHVYSYRGKDVRSNVEILPTGEIIFFSANLVILMDINGEERTQRIYQGHTCDVKCICVHPNKVIIASGQSSCHSSDKSPRMRRHQSPVESPDELVRQLEMEHTDAHVRIWDSVKLTTLFILGGFEAGFEKGICQLSFSNFDSGIHLACVDESTKHLLSVWNWQKSKKVAEVKAANDVVFDCKWHPSIKNLLVLYGKGHFSFFTLDSTHGVLIKTVAAFEGRDKPKTVLSMCFGPAGQVITGDSNGTISLWDPTTYKTTKHAYSVHPGGVYSLAIGKTGKLLSGGKDRMISEWELEDLVRSRRPVELPDDRGFARIIVPHSNDDIIIGTSNNCLFKISLDSANALSSLIEGDGGELSGMVVNPTHIVTSSQCGTVRKWSISGRKVEWSKKFMDGVECLDIDPTGTFLIVGFSCGSWQIINMNALETLKEHKEGQFSISALKFAPNGSAFAVCTREPTVVLYRLEGARNLINLSKIRHIPSPIIDIDWSSDSQFIRAQTSGSHLLFWSTSGEILDGSTVRDLKWDRATCRIGFETALVAHSTNGKICSVAKSIENDLVAAGMEDGTVRIYQNPVKSVTAGCVELFGHGKFAKGVGFASKSQFFSFSSDNSIFEWNIL